MSDKWMQKGDVQDFKTRAEFEAQEGKIMAHNIFKGKVMFWTKDGTYTMPIEQWAEFNKAGEEEV